MITLITLTTIVAICDVLFRASAKAYDAYVYGDNV